MPDNEFDDVRHDDVRDTENSRQDDAGSQLRDEALAEMMAQSSKDGPVFKIKDGTVTEMGTSKEAFMQERESNGLEQVPGSKGGHDGLYRDVDDLDAMIRGLKLKSEPTAEEIKEAKEALEKQVSKLIPAEQRELVLGMQNALIDGDVATFDKLVKGLKKNPELLEKIVEEIEHNLKEAGAGVHIALNKDGNVLLYKNHASHALEFTSDGKPNIRPISQRFDGTVVLEPGEVIGKKASEVLKDIGDEAVRDITRPPFKWIEPPSIRPLPYPYPNPLDKILPRGWVEEPKHEFPGTKPYWMEKPGKSELYQLLNDEPVIDARFRFGR